MHSPRHRRRAAILLIVLGCFVVAAGLLASLMQNAFLARAQSDARHHEMQASWLAESAVARARSQLAANAEYRGETWTIPAAELSAAKGGVVQILVTPLEDISRWQIEVISDYPDHPEQRVRKRRQVVISVQPTASDPPLNDEDPSASSVDLPKSNADQAAPEE